LSASCTFSDYVTGAEAVLEAAAAYMTDVGSAYKRRREWGSEVLRSRATVVLQMDMKQEKVFERYFGRQVEEVLGGMDWSEWRVGERGGGGGGGASAGGAAAGRRVRGVVISE
jgi:hypothetical protein